MHSFIGHPAGAAGAALLVLRIAGALMLSAACIYACNSVVHPWAFVLLALPAVPLFLGLWTRAAASLCTLAALYAGADIAGWPGAMIAISALDFVAIALLGGGAYSIDARLYGRRVLTLDR